MNKSKTLRLGLLVALILPAALAISQNAGKPAPKFTIQSTEGKTLSLKDLQGEGIVFLYFIRNGDAVNDEASNYIHRIIRAYSPNTKSKWFGVFSGNDSQARSWQAEHNPPYKLLMDRDNKVARMYRIESSPAIVEIDGKGNIVREWQGYSGYWLKDLNGFASVANNKKKATIDFSRTPSTTRFGRPYGQP
jgi:peroxiredoxin